MYMYGYKVAFWAVQILVSLCIWLCVCFSQVRELHYDLEQEQEECRASDGLYSKLKQQLEQMEDALRREVAAHQQAEFEKKEFEMEQEALKIANQQVCPSVCTQCMHACTHTDACTHTHTHLCKHTAHRSCHT